MWRHIFISSLFFAASLSHATNVSQFSTDSVGGYEAKDQKPSIEKVEPKKRQWQQRALTAGADTAAQKVEEPVIHLNKAMTSLEQRPTEIQKSSRSHLFSIWEAGTSLLRDEDDDGYHARFKIRFDADVSLGDAKVYAKLYIRRVGDAGPWYRFYTTDDFWIYGTSGTDDYYVDTVLSSGYPTGEYDVLIDLYEVGYSDIVATVGPFEFSALRDLPLEQESLDRPLANLGFHFDSARTELLQDNDRDGFYSKFRITVDPDMVSGSAEAYLIVWTRANNGSWQEELRSNTFNVYANSSDDKYELTAEWQNGYTTDYYDFRIELVDVLSGLIVTSIGSEDPSLSRVPLEDLTKDQLSNPPVPPPSGGDRDSESREGGGGSLGWFSVFMLPLVVRKWGLQKSA